MRAVFAGTPDFAVPSLEALLNSGTEVIAVYCQPDRPAGRGQKLRPCAVKARAMVDHLTVRQPADLKNEASYLTDQKIDIAVVAAYGMILPPAMLAAPTLGCVNVHASLLPRWRGAAPIQRAIEAGDSKSGVTLMEMDAGLDTGPIIEARQTAILESENSQSLHDRLAILGAEMLSEFLERLATGPIVSKPQPETGVTYAGQLTRDEAWLDWRRPADELARQIRAFNPWPLARSKLDGTDYRIHQAALGPTGTSATPGTITIAHGACLRVQTGAGALDLLKLQRPGGKALDTKTFLNGHAIRTGSAFTLPSEIYADR
ncbi:MAG TPA: methionyl-tRNA formyltransferase [Gammaproteobacteria bacterium]|jgi:methionyl-tRNA formyltransferase|nr:methionyl-tRNA formyltransferase [Arenicellales bacterium]MDP6550851.1 methionyl-tRNA formyltransferase [Arenicellales bacterium]MDP6790773.1 methionyl-tRNA formyltransferase [Arenicellales bacterium]MDP6917885.1 methionyl-tRNA formyltransferase [Arenicellales bacterium]HCX87122.1 methionyl-tRNA formyltransferase [Gammaproteobacteria bacterium]|tara:strand:+ start:2788 stop:3738 length:951 start_codon:yes stop_codon:yes gene_type:complete